MRPVEQEVKGQTAAPDSVNTASKRVRPNLHSQLGGEKAGRGRKRGGESGTGEKAGGTGGGKRDGSVIGNMGKQKSRLT